MILFIVQSPTRLWKMNVDSYSVKREIENTCFSTFISTCLLCLCRSQQNNTRLFSYYACICARALSCLHVFSFSQALWDSSPSLSCSCSCFWGSVFLFLREKPAPVQPYLGQNLCLSVLFFFLWRMRESQLSDPSRGCSCNSFSPNSRSDKAALLTIVWLGWICTFRGLRPPFCWLKSSDSHSCHSWSCYGNWSRLSGLIQKQTLAKGKQTRGFIFQQQSVLQFSLRSFLWVCVTSNGTSAFCFQTKVQYRRWSSCPAITPCRKISSWRSWKCLRSAAFVVFSIPSLSLSSSSVAKNQREQKKGRGGVFVATSQRPGAARQGRGDVKEMDVLQRWMMGNMLLQGSEGLSVLSPVHMWFYQSRDQWTCDQPWEAMSALISCWKWRRRNRPEKIHSKKKNKRTSSPES